MKIYENRCSHCRAQPLIFVASKFCNSFVALISSVEMLILVKVISQGQNCDTNEICL